MSFLKITDPTIRDLIVKDYLETKKVREPVNNNYKVIFQSFRPLTETQKATVKKVVEVLKPRRF